MSIDECLAEALVLGEILAQHVKVDHHHTDGQTYLRRCKTNTIAGIESLEHIGNKSLKLGIFWGDIFGNLS